MTPAPRLQVKDVRVRRRAIPLRMPFRFGAVTMNSMDVLALRIEAEMDGGGRVIGESGSVLSPAWFDRRADVTYERKEQGLLLSVSLAAQAALRLEPATGFEIHQAVESCSREGVEELRAPLLVASFGPGLIDAAITDAVCRGERVSLHQAIAGDLLGRGHVPGLPESAAEQLEIRHTVGLLDPLRSEELEGADDALPQSLDQVLARYGHRWLKVKVSSDVELMTERLGKIAAVVANSGLDVRYTMDGNESFKTPDSYEQFIRRVMGEPSLAGLWSATAWVEQPLERDVALERHASLDRALSIKPVVLDESDASDEVMEEALGLGYAGVSIKGCKGIYRALHSASVAAERRSRGEAVILSSEDLTCQPVVGLHQDLSLVAALGIGHTERNGHHYVRGLDALPDDLVGRMLASHGRMYSDHGGVVSVRIEEGSLDVRDLDRPPGDAFDEPGQDLSLGP